MSGLDSIAMAVALLEEQRRQHQPTMPQRAMLAKVISSDSDQQETDTIVSTKEQPSPETCLVEKKKATPLSLSIMDTVKNQSKEDSTVYDQNFLFHFIFSLNLNELAVIPVPGSQEVITWHNEQDILLGRGGETNNHRGNIQYRQYVKACQAAYIECKRRDKPFIAQRIVLAVRKAGGRFLKKDKDSGTWRDVGNVKAREKTSQALREGAPDLRDVAADSVEGHMVAAVSTMPKRKAELVSNKRAAAAVANHYPTLVLSSHAPVNKRQCNTLQRMPPTYGCRLPPPPPMAYRHHHYHQHHHHRPCMAEPPHVIASSYLNEESIPALSTSDAPRCLPTNCHKGPRVKLLKKRLEGQTV